MSEHNLLLETGVLIGGANVAAASVLAGLAGLSLRRCVGRRSLPLEHGVLTAALAVLLLAPLCLLLSSGIPGIGIECRIASTDAAGEPAAADAREKPVADIDEETAAVVATSDDVGIALGRIDAEAADSDINGEAVPAFPRPEPELPGPASEVGAFAESSPAVAPVVAAEGPAHTGPATAAAADPATPLVKWDIRRLGSILLLIWAVGVVVSLAHCVSGFLLVARLRRQARNSDSPEIASLAGSVAAQLGMRRLPHVLLTDRVDIPLTLGLRHPVILLPADLVESASGSRLRAILLHEAAHVARRDLWIGVLQRLAAALYWWNPLVHLLNRRLNDVRESLCDNHVLLAGEDVRDYADTLLTLAARIARPARTASAVGLVGRPSPGLSGRVTHLLEEERDMSVRLTSGARRMIVLMTFSVFCGLSLAAVRLRDESTESSGNSGATSSAADVEPASNRDTGMLAPRDPVAESDVAPLLVVNPDAASGLSTEVVEWKPFIAVRAVFDRLENARRLARRLGRPRLAVEDALQIIDFELQRQSRRDAESAWSEWETLHIGTARDLLHRTVGFDADVVSSGVTDPAITMPLPMRAIGDWDTGLISHPLIGAAASGDSLDGAGDEMLFRYMDFDITTGGTLRYRMRIEFGLARETVWTDWSEPTREVTVPAAGDGVQRGLLDVSRSIVRIETAVDGEFRSGSGVLVTGSAAKEHGMQSILTSAHLLKGFDAGRHALNVQLFDDVTPRTRTPDYVSIEEDAGLALLCFSDLKQDLPTASIAPLRRRPEVGDDATFHWWIDGRIPAKFSTHRVVAVDRYAGPSNLECTGLPQPGQPSGGLFNARLELIGIAVGTDRPEMRTVFTSLPAILEFLDIDGEPADERPTPQPASPTNPYGLPVTGSPIGLPGPPHVPIGGPGPGALHPADVERIVILIALGADDAGALAEVHFLTESLGAGDEAVDALTTRLAAAAEESAAAQRELHVQISVDPRLKYESVARIMDVCRAQGAADVRLALLRPDEDFVINIGFVRDGEGRKLSEAPVVFWEDRVRGVDDLSGILGTERQQRPGADVTVVLRADSDVPGGVIQDVIRQVQEAGFEKFVLRVLHADAHPPELHGTVLEVMETSGGVVVQISIGRDDGLRRGDRLDVFRGDSIVNRERVGRIEITLVNAEQSVARVLEFQADAPIARGDQVVARADSRYPRNLSRLIPDGDEHPLAIQLHIQESAGLHVHWTDPVSGESEHLTAPCRVNVTPGLLSLTLTDIPGKPGLLLRSTIEAPVATSATSAWLEHNAVPIELTDEDFAQVESGNFVVKVIYLSDPGLQETPDAGVETLVSTRLDPGVDPVEEAEQRGTVLAVVRLGNRAVDRPTEN